MVGLHTCGDLAPNTLRIFTSMSEVKGVCSVGCCYHLLCEEFENPLSGTQFHALYFCLFVHSTYYFPYLICVIFVQLN